MLVARVLLRDDVEVARMASAIETAGDGSRLGSPAASVCACQAGFVRRMEFLAESLLENSPTRPPRRTTDFAVSATAQTIFLAGLFLLPLYFSKAIDIHQFTKNLLVAPPPPGPPPLSASNAGARPAAPKRRASLIEGKSAVPRIMPRQIARVTEEPGGNDLSAAIGPGDGVPGGVPGGQPGGVIGGILSGPVVPPAPIDSAPKGPIRVGEGVKAPRVLFGPQPVYPLLARQSRIGGAVVIDAVIDTQGNVIEMRTVSGQPILALAAMEALRHWKYEQTTLGGQAFPVRLHVTITFDLK